MITRFACLALIALIAVVGCGAPCKTNLPAAREKTRQALANIQANYDFWTDLLEAEQNPRVKAYIVLADQALGKLGPLVEVIQAGACPPEHLVADALETAGQAQQTEPQR